MPFLQQFHGGYGSSIQDCELTHQIWNTISDYLLNPDNSDMQFIDWIDFINRNEKSYHRKYKNYWHYLGNMDTQELFCFQKLESQANPDH